MATESNNDKNITKENLPSVTIRFAGDSGDGMQLVGTRFTDTSAIYGNDLATLPSFPAEIRAPQGTVAGISSFQIQISDYDILTPGDAPDVLVAMNPASLKAHLHDLAPNGMLIVNSDAFIEKNFEKAGYATDPRESGELDGYRVFEVPMEKLTQEALKDSPITGRGVLRSKNMIALGLIAWVFNRPLEDSISWIENKFKDTPEVVDANVTALKTGYNFGITVEAFHHTYTVEKANLPKGEYTNINGNISLSWGLIAAAEKAGLNLFYASYPITPASDILHELSKHKNFGVITFQAEDEIAAAASAVGSSFTGKLAVTGTSGPGLALKSETISLAVATELPMIIIDVQRGGPSTGLPTKPEQSDLLFALYGRHGESPIPVVAIRTPSHAFDAAMEASRIALKYMTPVILLSDNYIATGSEPWRLPDTKSISEIDTNLTKTINTNEGFYPYLRDMDTFGRPWAIPGVPGLEHRIGGLEKEEGTGNVSYGSVTQAVRRLNSDGVKVASANLMYLNPFPDNTGEVLKGYKKIIIPELNTGQLLKLIRERFLIDAIGINKVEGVPFTADELKEKIKEKIDE